MEYIGPPFLWILCWAVVAVAVGIDTKVIIIIIFFFLCFFMFFLLFLLFVVCWREERMAVWFVLNTAQLKATMEIKCVVSRKIYVSYLFVVIVLL